VRRLATDANAQSRHASFMGGPTMAVEQVTWGARGDLGTKPPYMRGVLSGCECTILDRIFSRPYSLLVAFYVSTAPRFVEVCLDLFFPAHQHLAVSLPLIRALCTQAKCSGYLSR